MSSQYCLLDGGIALKLFGPHHQSLDAGRAFLWGEIEAFSIEMEQPLRC